MQKLASGDKSVKIPGIGRRDEIGEMADALQVFKESALEMERVQAERADEMARQQKETQERADKLDSLTKTFDQNVTAALQAVGSAASRMETDADSMATTAADTTQQSTAAAASSQQTAANVQTVAAAAEELSDCRPPSAKFPVRLLSRHAWPRAPWPKQSEPTIPYRVWWKLPARLVRWLA